LNQYQFAGLFWSVDSFFLKITIASCTGIPDSNAISSIAYAVPRRICTDFCWEDEKPAWVPTVRFPYLCTKIIALSLSNDPENNRVYTSFRTSMDMGMGGVYLFVGGYVLYSQLLTDYFKNAAMGNFLGGLILVYGLFRIYRGLKAAFPSRRNR